MAKGRPPEIGKDIGIVRVTPAGTVWTKKAEAEIAKTK
jgi:hypothetical protein